MIDTETPPGGRGSGQGQSEGDKYKNEAWRIQQQKEQEAARKRAQEIIKEQEEMRERAKRIQR